jgi:hypothetical protein
MGLRLLAIGERIVGKDPNISWKKQPLLTLLGFFDKVECSVPRDVVYGFMGMVSEDLLVPVDYNKPIQDILLDVLLSGLKPFGHFNASTLSKVGIRIGLTRSQHTAWDRMVTAIQDRCEIPSNHSYKYYVPPEAVGFVAADDLASSEVWKQPQSSLYKNSKLDGCWWYEWEGEMYTFPCVIELNHDPGQNGPLANEFGDWRLLPQFAVGEPPSTRV